MLRRSKVYCFCKFICWLSAGHQISESGPINLFFGANCVESATLRGGRGGSDRQRLPDTVPVIDFIWKYQTGGFQGLFSWFF